MQLNTNQEVDILEYTYKNYYEKKFSDKHVYPVEWVVRTFLGTYPLLKMNKNLYADRKILDLGFGDGRNFPLLNNLNFKISGVEISESIVEMAKRKFANFSIPVDLRVGRNSKIPFREKTFDFVLACHSLYYVDKNETFTNNLEEIARVLKPNGLLIASLPRSTGSILHDAKPLQNGHVKIINDPLGLRNGSIFRIFESKLDIENTFDKYFTNFVIGYCDDDFFGIHQNVWILVCARNNN